MAVTSGGRHLVTAGHDTTIRIWDPQVPPSGREPVQGRVTALAVAPDGSWMAVGGQDGSVRIQGTGRASPRTSPVGHLQKVTAMAVASHGGWLVTGSDDATIRVWPKRPGVVRRVLADDHEPGARTLVMDPATNWVVAAVRDGSVVVLDPVTGRRWQAVAGDDVPVTHLVLARLGGWLVAARGDGRLTLAGLAPGGNGGSAAERALPPLAGPIGALAAASDGSYVAYGGTDGLVRVQALTEALTAGTVATPLGDPVDLAGHDSGVVAAAVGPEPRRLVTASWDGTVRTWWVPDGRSEYVLTGHDGAVRDVACPDDGSWLVTVGDKSVRAWSLRDGSPLAALRVEADLHHVVTTGDVVIAAGDRGPYFFSLVQPPGLG